MNLTNLLSSRRAVRPPAAATGLVAALALSALLGASAHAEDMYRQAPRAGGVTPRTTITSISQSGSNVTLTWYGPQGTYFIEAAPLADPTNYTRVGQTISSDFAGSYTIVGGATNSQLFRVVNYNGYVGQGGCAGCHGDKYDEWLTTKHSEAWAGIANLPPAVRQTCMPCHTVGFGEVSGFVSAATTPHLMDVGCENCHGPAGAHKYGDHDIVHPAVSIDPAICGGCHSGDHNPTLNEYETSLHAEVNDDIKYGASNGTYYPDTIVLNGQTLYGYYVTSANGVLKTNATTGIINSSHVPGSAIDPGNDRAASCGVCHSGAFRMALLNDWEARQDGIVKPLEMPSAQDMAAWGPTCAVCHDPHEDYNIAQLRNPTRSTNYFTMPTTTDKRITYVTNSAGIQTNVAFYGTAFASFYDPTINVCGQCHNSRGARWDGRGFGLVTNGTAVTVGLTTNVSFTRGPHHSPQYNLLIGIVQPDYLNTNSAGVATNYIARHGLGVSSSSGIYNTNQCATCHVPSYTTTNGTAITYTTGHSFALDTRGCALGGCHTRGVPNIEEFQTGITNSITTVVSLLSQWATNKAPALFGANYSKYKENSWEYTTIGALATVTNAGPSSADQNKLPNSIKQARFNTYIALNDGSLGVHNPKYTPFLLTDAANKVKGEFKLANFKAGVVSGPAPLTVTFTNLGTGATTYSWSFGDGNTSTSANPSNTYTAPGVYSVTLTASDGTTTETLTLPNYITVQ